MGVELGDYIITIVFQTATIIFTLYYKIGRLEERIKALEREVFNGVGRRGVGGCH